MKEKIRSKGSLIALAILALVVSTMILRYSATRPSTERGGKNIVVQVVHGDGSSKDFSLSTEKEFLGDALVEGGIVEENQGQFGLFIVTVDGETADDSKQEWWNVCKDGEFLQVGADSQPIADGEHYELLLTVGYDS